MAPAPETTSVSLSAEQARGLLDFKMIDVNITSLTDFAEALRQEIAKNVEPVWNQIRPTLLEDKPWFGNSAELELGPKRSEYERYLRSARTLVFNIMEGMRQLADAAEAIGSAYREADQFAQVTSGDVERRLPTIQTTTASTEPQPQPQASAGGTYRAV
jgi:hypothetical protein